MPTLDTTHIAFLEEVGLGRLATVAPSGAPHNKPVGFVYNRELGTIDIAGFEMENSAKFRNVGVHPRVSFVVDDRPDPAAGAGGVRFMEIRGLAEQTELADGPIFEGTTKWIIRVHPRRVLAYNVRGAELETLDLDGDGPPTLRPARPALHLEGVAGRDGRGAVDAFVAEIQRGLDRGDADVYNHRFADDVMWGSPYGGVVDGGYDVLHPIHARMLGAGAHTRSRYELVRAVVPAPDVALATVRRTALDEDGGPIPSTAGTEQFSEMALYVLVRRDGEWWLAAGQNTVVNVDRGAVRQP